MPAADGMRVSARVRRRTATLIRPVRALVADDGPLARELGPDEVGTDPKMPRVSGV